MGTHLPDLWKQPIPSRRLLGDVEVVLQWSNIVWKISSWLQATCTALEFHARDSFPKAIWGMERTKNRRDVGDDDRLSTSVIHIPEGGLKGNLNSFTF